MSATSPQTRPNVKQAVASFNRRHFAAAADDQFRVGSYVVHTPPSEPPKYSYASAVSAVSQAGVLALSQRQPPSPRTFACSDEPAQVLQRTNHHHHHHQFAVRSEQPPPLAYVPTSNAVRHLDLNESATPNSGHAKQQLNRSLLPAHAPASPPTIISNNNNKLQFPTSSSLPSRAPASQSASPSNSQRIKLVKSPQQNETNNSAMGDYLSTPYLSSRIPQESSLSPKHQHTAHKDQNSLSTESDSDSTPKFHYKRRIPATSSSRSPLQVVANNRCEITPRLPRGISRIPHQIYHAKKTGNDAEESLGAARDDSRFLTFSKDQANSHARSIKKHNTTDTQPDRGDAEEYEENLEVVVAEARSKSPPQSNSTLSLNDSHHPIPVERQFIKSRNNSPFRSATVAPARCDPPTSNEIEALPKTASSTSCRQQPICEAFIMTGQSMLKLSCTETNNNSQSASNGNNNKLQQEQETRLDKSSVSAKLDNQTGEATNTNVELVGGDKTVCASVSSVATVSPMAFAQEPATWAGIPRSDPRAAVTAAGPVPTTTTPKESPDSTMVEEHLAEEEHKAKRINANEEAEAEEEEEDKNCTGVAANECHTESASRTPDKMGDKSSLIDESSHSLWLAASTGAGCTYDLDSAKRLARRLYTLSGFKKSDVSHHLGKSNQFSEMVAEEYLNLFDFKSMKLDAALRKFLSKFHLNGETQERERILSRFSQRYYICNRDKFPNSDIVQTLVCALILLNTDLHGRHRGKSKSKRSCLSLGAFIDGLNSSVVTLAAAGADDKEAPEAANLQATPYSLPRHILVDLYEAIKKKPLKSNDENCDMSMFESELDKIYSQHQNNQAASFRSSTLPTRRFLPTGSSMAAATMNSHTKHRYRLGLSKLNLFDSNNKLARTAPGPPDDKTIQPIQFKSGYLNKKRTFEANGKATVKGKRSWTRVHVALIDLNLIFQAGIKDEREEFRLENQKGALKELKNSVKIYHCLAKPTTTYKKRNFVFHLGLADQSEYLLQASDLTEMTAWIEAINFASACLSAAVLPTPVSSAASQRTQKVPHKPTLPVSYTKLKYWDQLVSHEERLQKLRADLEQHLAAPPNTKSAKKSCKNRFIERIAYLQHEIQRYSVYVDLMRKKSNSSEAMFLSKNPHLTTSLAPPEKMIKPMPSFGPSIEGQAQLEFS